MTEDVFKCPECGEEFESEDLLEKHNRLEHSIEERRKRDLFSRIKNIFQS